MRVRMDIAMVVWLLLMPWCKILAPAYRLWRFCLEAVWIRRECCVWFGSGPSRGIGLIMSGCVLLTASFLLLLTLYRLPFLALFLRWFMSDLRSFRVV